MRYKNYNAPSALSNLTLAIAMLAMALFAAPAIAQEPLDKAPVPAETKPAKQQKPEKKEKPVAQEDKSNPLSAEERQALRREDPAEDAAGVLPYINNFFSTTRLGPEDVISVDVFEQPSYSRPTITVPPSGKIHYPHIGQILVAGRTIEDLEKEITEKLSEYIREPVVTVQLLQVHSLKYLVIGDVTSPGIYEMTKRMTVTEALAKAGYVSRYGDLKNVSVLRNQPGGRPVPIPVNVKEVVRGKAQDVYLVPGDTVFVPGNTFKTVERVLGLLSTSAWVRIVFAP